MTILAFFWVSFLAIELWHSWKAKGAAPKKAPDDAEIRDAIIERLEALEAKVYLLIWAAAMALFIGLNEVWRMNGWQGVTLPFAWFAACIAAAAVYQVTVGWKTFSLRGKVVVWLVFGIIGAALHVWLPSAQSLTP